MTLDTAGQRLAPVGQQPRLLEGFTARITVHAPLKRAAKVAEVCAQEDLGAIYALPSTCSTARRFLLARAVTDQHTARVGTAGAVLLDAQRYSGKNRIPGTKPHHLDWTAHQHELGLSWALTDSGYIAEGDLDALRNTLAEGGRHRGQTVVALPVHHSWLGRRATQLRKAVDEAGLPVALMVEHRDDPFSTRATVEGLLEVLAAQVPVALLRCDISAIGALAYGAAVGAVGTNTSLRHIYPLDAGGGRAAQPAAVVPRALVYKQLDRIAEAVRADPDHTHWICPCSWCAGRLLDWLIDPDDAFQHSLAALAALAEYVLSSPDPRGTWRDKCHVAQFANLDIEAETGLDWQAPRFLGHWINV